MKKNLVAALAVMIAVTAFSVNQPANAFKLWPSKKSKEAVETPVADVKKEEAAPAPAAEVKKPCPVKKECKPCEKRATPAVPAQKVEGAKKATPAQPAVPAKKAAPAAKKQAHQTKHAAKHPNKKAK
jgi:hypothetical protein